MGGGGSPLPPGVIMTTSTNPEVLAVCYAQGWCANADKMTQIEAEAVTTIGTAFRNNSSITHFEEFRYFTSVTMLYQYAFNKCSNLEVITLPTTITQIEYNAFGECSNLTTINLDNVTSLGGAVFYLCSKLDNIQLTSLTSIGSQCFMNCSSLTNVTLPSAITSLPNSCFRGCSSLNLTTTTPLTSIGNRALNNTGISQIDLSGIVTLGTSAFEGSKVTSIDIGEDCTSIADAVCYNCKQLQYVIIRATTPPTLANGNHAFTNGSSNYPIYVPDSAYETYLAATNWSYYSTRIKKISEKP